MEKFLTSDGETFVQRDFVLENSTILPPEKEVKLRYKTYGTINRERGKNSTEPDFTEEEEELLDKGLRAKTHIMSNNLDNSLLTSMTMTQSGSCHHEHSSTMNDHDSSSSSAVVVVAPLADEIENNRATTTTEEPEPEPELTEEELLKKKRNCYKKTAIALILVAFITFVVVDSLTHQYIKDGVNDFLEWIEANPVEGFFAFMLVCFVTTILFIPGVILTVGAGFVFASTFGLGVGVLLGTVAVFVGASAGAIASFLLGRFLLRDCIYGLTKKYTIFEALDHAFEENGFRILALLRLSPLVYVSPYLNYGAGGTAVSFWAYVWALFAILPGTVLYVFLGASAGSLADSAQSGDDSTVTTIVIVVGIVFSFLAVALTSYYAKKELNKVARANRQADVADADDVENNSMTSLEA
jgi:uncharacterized membrane protein YdjX (TVP38/TMEM64 family)